jgi:hypothetical protein
VSSTYDPVQRSWFDRAPEGAVYMTVWMRSPCTPHQVTWRASLATTDHMSVVANMLSMCAGRGSTAWSTDRQLGGG